MSSVILSYPILTAVIAVGGIWALLEAISASGSKSTIGCAQYGRRVAVPVRVKSRRDNCDRA